MAGSGNDRQKLFSRIFLGAVVLVLAGGMLLYLVPSMPGNGGDAPADAVATVGDQNITSTEILQRLNEVEQRNPTPYAKMLEPTYIRQILNECWRASGRHSPEQLRIGRRVYGRWYERHRLAGQ